jgi:hypothetical protein
VCRNMTLVVSALAWLSVSNSARAQAIGEITFSCEYKGALCAVVCQDRNGTALVDYPRVREATVRTIGYSLLITLRTDGSDTPRSPNPASFVLFSENMRACTFGHMVPASGGR